MYFRTHGHPSSQGAGHVGRRVLRSGRVPSRHPGMLMHQTNELAVSKPSWIPMRSRRRLPPSPKRKAPLQSAHSWSGGNNTEVCNSIACSAVTALVFIENGSEQEVTPIGTDLALRKNLPKRFRFPMSHRVHAGRAVRLFNAAKQPIYVLDRIDYRISQSCLPRLAGATAEGLWPNLCLPFRPPAV